MVQQLRVLNSFPGDPIQFLAPKSGGSQAPLTPVQENAIPSSGFGRQLTYVMYIHTIRKKYMKINK